MNRAFNSIVVVAIIAVIIGCWGFQQSAFSQDGKCGDGICDEFEKRAHPNACPKDCKENCVGEAGSIPVIPKAPSCCEGLTLIKPKEPEIIGSQGTCTSKCGNGACDLSTETAYNCPQDCAATTYRDVPKNNLTEEKGIVVAKESCEAEGGKWGIWSDVPGARPECNLPTSDSEKSCEDSRECESYCEAPKDAEMGIKSVGRCYGFKKAISIKEIKNGIVAAEWCY